MARIRELLPSDRREQEIEQVKREFPGALRDGDGLDDVLRYIWRLGYVAAIEDVRLDLHDIVRQADER